MFWDVAAATGQNCTMVYNGDGSEANDAVVTLGSDCAIDGVAPAM